MDKRIGAQYYTIRDFIQNIEDFDASCKKISDIGYKLVQISGTPLKAKEMREVLDKYGLKAVTSHRSFADFKNNLDEIIDYNKTLGIELCGIGAFTPLSDFAYPERIKAFIKDVGEICEVLASENMYFGYHNHAAELIKYKGKLMLDMLAEETDPKVFKFIVDCYWLQYGGVDAAEYITKLGDRAMAVHFKDLGIKSGTNDCCMYEIGEGNLNWDRIIPACENAGVKWALVEQDICQRDPFESLKMSYDYLTKKGFN